MSHNVCGDATSLLLAVANLLLHPDYNRVAQINTCVGLCRIGLRKHGAAQVIYLDIAEHLHFSAHFTTHVVKSYEPIIPGDTDGLHCILARRACIVRSLGIDRYQELLEQLDNCGICTKAQRQALKKEAGPARND